MAIFRCKMCGGTLEISNESVATCEYCGTQQTLPKLDDERRANLYDRANHFRRNNEFDKAMAIYEQILNEDNSDAEAYWSLVLCRYGIEYVEDPASRKRIPTVNRAQFTSIYDDSNYKSALEYADGNQRTVYEAEAKAINEIQKGILTISQKEEPFDVFICYKETDEHGRRTHDSVLATELYHELVELGYKVFFSRITLEDKLGTAYEPYIFAALNSAKVMVVLGTKPEYFNAVWVKNEWSRYLSLIKGGAKKVLIPAYRDMDPYDLPEEFSHLQAQDMSKLGFMQDLIRGIKKLATVEQPKPVVKETVIVNTPAAPTVADSIAPLLKRAFMFLEDGDFIRADGFCEQVLNIDPENAEAYLVKLLAELKVKSIEDLKSLAEPFDNKSSYQKAIKFGDEDTAVQLTEAQELVKKRHTEEAARIEKEKKDAKNRKIKQLLTISIASILAVAALVIYVILPLVHYNTAEKLYATGQYEEAKLEYEALGDYKDSYLKAEIMRNHITYNNAEDLFESGQYDEAASLFDGLGDFEDAKERAQEVRYYHAIHLTETKNYEQAAKMFGALGDYKDAHDKMYESNYNDAVQNLEKGNYQRAYNLFKNLGQYNDSKGKVDECIYAWAASAVEDYNDATTFKSTVTLESKHYATIYQTVFTHINSHTEFDYWDDYQKGTRHSRAVLEMLNLLPNDYEDVANLKKLFTIFITGNVHPIDEFIKDNSDFLKQMWYVEFLHSFVARDSIISHFLAGLWRTSDRYFYLEFTYDEEDGSMWSSFDLPWVAKPSGTEFWYLHSMTFYWGNPENNHLAEVYKFTIIDYDTIEVYCYKNEHTYTLYREID